MAPWTISPVKNNKSLPRAPAASITSNTAQYYTIIERCQSTQSYMSSSKPGIVETSPMADSDGFPENTRLATCEQEWRQNISKGKVFTSLRADICKT